tara:strand:- start:1151 stop:1543 length:393 start_codon:yes stop_codon:yes gene_type:complete
MAAKKRSDSVVHVRVDNPISKRKEILAITINTVELLKRYERIKLIQKEKAQTLALFRTKMRSLNRLSKLVGLKEMPLQMNEVKKVKSVKGKKVFNPVKKVKAKKVKKKELTGNEKLDVQLDELRRKLDNL